MGNKVSGEHLAVMGMTTKIKINTCSYGFCQFFGLVVNENNWFALIQSMDQLGWSLPGAFGFFTAGGILAANYIEFVVNQNGLIVQQVDSCVCKKFFHSWIVVIVFFSIKSEACKDWLVEVVIAPTGVNSIF